MARNPVLSVACAVLLGAGALVALAEIGAFERRPEDLTIYHKDLDRTVFVLGDVTGRPPADVVFSVESDVAVDPLPHGAEATWTGEGEWKITVDVFRDLGIAFAAVLVLIYVLVVAWFQSFITPLVIMAPIPLTLIGILPAHAAS